MCEKCDRCGQEGEDRRTIWMSCFYALDELDIPPLEKVRIIGSVQPKVGTEVIGMTEFTKFSESDGKKISLVFFRLRVCKACRADWLQAIEAWFNRPLTERPSCGSGIFIRDCGALREITEEEWYARNPGQEPVRAVGLSCESEK